MTAETETPRPDAVPTVFFGSGRFGLEPLRRLAAHPAVDVVGVVTAPPRPAGRNRELRRTPIHELAGELGIPVLTPERLRSAEAIASVLDLAPGLAVLADYGQIVPPALLEVPHGALNLHPSLLPRHRGASPIPATILAADTETGVTLMRMSEGLDSGPIVAVERVPLSGGENAIVLEARLEAVAADLLARSLEPWLAGELPATPQPEEGVTLTRPLRRGDGRLDPDRPAVELERQVRAYQPWPGSWLETADGRLTVWQAAVAATARRQRGTLARDGLETADGRLVLVEVQPAGGKRMPWDAFVRGRPALLGRPVAGPAS